MASFLSRPLHVHEELPLLASGQDTETDGKKMGSAAFSPFSFSVFFFQKKRTTRKNGGAQQDSVKGFRFSSFSFLLPPSFLL